MNNMVRLGELIELCDERNSNGVCGADDVMGMTITKELIPTKADVTNTDLKKFLVVKPNEFVYNPRTHGKRIGLGYNNTSKPFIISWNNTAFRVKDEERLLPAYLYMYLNRLEWDRNACFRSWGSSTEVFSWTEFCLMGIPLPSIEVQRELVAVYEGLKALAEENEAIIEHLLKACMAFMSNCKKSYSLCKLGELIEDYDQKNIGNNIKEVRSVSVYKDFRLTNAKVNKDELSGYKMVPPNHIAYVQTTKNEKCFANALNNTDSTFVVSSVDRVVKSKDEKVLNVAFLSLFFKSKEFDRYAIFHSWGSAREVFAYDDLCEVQIPLPPLDIQQKIVDLYNCVEECKRIAAEAREQLRMICPALVQKAAHAS